MITGFVNALINPGFRFWDYGEGPFTVSGYTASRWKMALTGAPTVSVARGTTSSSSNLPKWLRGRDHLAITVSAFNPAADTITITQRQEYGDMFGEQNTILSGIAFGPAGEHFYVSVEGHDFKVETQGVDGDGIDIPTHFAFPCVITDPATAYVSVECFSRPSATGDYKLAFVQLEYSEYASDPSPFEIRNYAVERQLLNRYVFPVPVGQPGIASTTSNFAMAIPFPVEMRTTPTFSLLKTNVNAILLSTAAAVNTAAAGSATAIHAEGARLVITGFGGLLTAGSVYYLGTEGVGIFTADY